MAGEYLEAFFPGLRESGYSIESPQSDDYNCIGWAASDPERWWWPLSPFDYWPPGVPQAVTLEAFVAAFRTLGYETCESERLELGFEKVAIFTAPDGSPTHMARQLPSGEWTSKLGPSEDITHRTLAALEGVQYGTVARTLRRAETG